MNSTNSTDSVEPVVFKSDGYIAASILCLTVLAVFLGSLYLCYNKKLLGIREYSSNGSSSVEPPIERANYIAAKEKLDPSNASDLDELKKLLMRRAIRAIPILLSLQNEGNSIERLYKRGMLTDDMHFKVKNLKAFVDQEFQDVQFEADDLVEGWSQHIWPQAMQFHTMIQKQAEGKAPLDSQPIDEEDEEEEYDEPEQEAEPEIVEVPKKKNKDVPKKQQQKDISPTVAGSVVPSIPEVPVVVDPIQEAEKMAKLLLAEEEKSNLRKKSSKNGKK